MELLKRIEIFLDDIPEGVTELQDSLSAHLKSLEALPEGADKKEAMRTLTIVYSKTVKLITVIQSVLKPNTP